MKDDLKDRAYEIGFCKPPKRAQFKPGQSGNLKGRPKGTLNLATVLERTLREKVTIHKSGKRTIVCKLEAALIQLANKAASGDLRALQLLTALARSAGERASQDAEPNSVNDEADEKV